MLNVLFIGPDTSNQLHSMYHYLEEELAKRIHLLTWRKQGHIDYILKHLPVRPDFIILLNDIGQRMEPLINGLAHTGIPSGLFVNDVHRFVKQRKNYIDKHHIYHLFTVTRDPFIRTYPEYIHKMNWLPHFVSTDVFQAYEMEKEIDLLMIGAVNDVYPLRQKIVQAYEGDASFVYHKHPGYGTSVRDADHLIVGKQYAKELNRAKIVFTCPSVFYYPVIKYFEVLACKTLLLAPAFPELVDLGFIPGEHFIAINERDFMEKASYYIENEGERKQIAERGYQFIRQQHSANLRAGQLVKKMESIVKNE